MSGVVIPDDKRAAWTALAVHVDYAGNASQKPKRPEPTKSDNKIGASAKLQK